MRVNVTHATNGEPTSITIAYDGLPQMVSVTITQSGHALVLNANCPLVIQPDATNQVTLRAAHR